MLWLTPEGFKDYELIDCGDFEKLERFGAYVLIRPEPQAVWSRRMNVSHWEKKAHTRFVPMSASSGTWKKLKSMPDRWMMTYVNPYGLKLTLRLALTAFKHTGLFPEQAVNWDFIFQAVSHLKQRLSAAPRVLNLFAYTGAASLAARAAGAEVTHVDSVKQVITWARENMELNHMNGIRWMVEDAMTFVKREIRRGKKYHGIILDPPAYGHGTDGKKWKLEEMIQEMITHVLRLLEPNHFLLLNTYSLGFSPLILENLLHNCKSSPQVGELFLKSQTGFKLPLGVFARMLHMEK
jgi:23S rRNA (cytosine1962-C5)-methyltransferase